MRFRGTTVSKQDIRDNLWLKYLCTTEKSRVNPERVESYEHMQSNPVLSYVGRMLDIAEKEFEEYEKASGKESRELSRDAYFVSETLKWAEVAKCGSESRRKNWKKKHLSLQVHNEASAAIYREEATDTKINKQIIYTLIYTHGLIGQGLRGEVELTENRLLTELIMKKLLTAEELKRILFVLNKAVIAAVSEDLWEKLQDEVIRVIDCICEDRLKNEDALTRIKLMLPATYGKSDDFTSEEKKVFENLLVNRYLWYPEVALDSFSREEVAFIFSMIARRIGQGKCRHISFYPLAVGLYYDYEGRKKVNVYKKRIIEFCLKEMMEGVPDRHSEAHVRFDFTVVDDTMYVDVVFTPVCEKLIAFCVEAERSGFMDYQKNITTIFDLFGFRRDIFDRLNNEEKYLETMNATEQSRKSELLDYVVGQTIVDVGSGGGVLLDKLEKKFPDKDIIGTDISANVIEALQNKIETEGHGYCVCRQNFVDAPFEKNVDCIIFSSILHEVYSYTEYEGEQFNKEAVRVALRNAVDSLRKGGRILIRDGVKTNSNRRCRIFLKDASGRQFLQNYRKDFRGLKELRDAEGILTEDNVSYDGEGVLTADINFIREFLYTYTWGEESYALEVNEQFGYFTLKEFEDCFQELGMKIVHIEEYLESGYKAHLCDKVELLDDFKWEDIPSNCIVIAEK